MELKENTVYLNFDGNQGRKIVNIEDNKVSYVKYDPQNNQEDTQVKECKLSSFKKWADHILVFPFKKMSTQVLDSFKKEVKNMLHANRDCLRNQGKDTRKIRFDVREGYYGEAFGMMRTLNILGYGYFGSTNLNAVEEHTKAHGVKPTNVPVDKLIPENNLVWWLDQIANEVLEEEGYFDQSYHCPVCEKKYRRGTY